MIPSLNVPSSAIIRSDFVPECFCWKKLEVFCVLSAYMLYKEKILQDIYIPCKSTLKGINA